MESNLDRYRKDLDALIAKGQKLALAMSLELQPGGIEGLIEKQHDPGRKKELEQLPSFADEYQAWYSESKVLIRQLLPDRLADFVRHYEKPKPRKELTPENYRIEDYLQGLSVAFTSGYRQGEVVVSLDAAVPHLRQQRAILESVKARFESSLFDIRQLVQADLFDSELDAARELNKKGFTRGAGAVAGVVLEKHLAQVCDNHQIRVTKKDPGTSDLNAALKNAEVIETPVWRSIQHLADLRNLCDHHKKKEPTKEQVEELIDGAMRITKTLF